MKQYRGDGLAPERGTDNSSPALPCKYSEFIMSGTSIWLFTGVAIYCYNHWRPDVSTLVDVNNFVYYFTTIFH